MFVPHPPSYPSGQWWIETSLFSNSQGWNADPAYFGTIRFIDINGDGLDDVCGRGPNGFECWHSWGYTFNNSPIQGGFADYDGWSAEDQWVTLTFADVTGDGLPDICGRHATGIMCARNAGTYFEPPTHWTYDFSDGDGWHTDPSRYSTIRFPDLNGDGFADICGRYSDGIRCAFNSGGGGWFYPVALWSDAFSDAEGWSSGAEYYSTIEYVDVSGDGKVDVCGRDANGIVCAVNTSCAAFEPPTVWASHFTDADGWNADPAYFSTLRFVDINGDGLPDVCGRGVDGIECAHNEVMRFGVASLESYSFSDAAGWGPAPYTPRYYETIRFPR